LLGNLPSSPLPKWSLLLRLSGQVLCSFSYHQACYMRCPIRYLHCYFATDGRSVSQSVRLDVEPLWNSWPNFGCSREDSFVVGRLPVEWMVLSCNGL
jgi:hypothetical protein